VSQAVASGEAAPTAIETVVPLRWRDMDAYGHVNHAVYLTYLEQGRDAALSQLLRDTPDDMGYVVARVEIDYRRELRLADGPVVVSCRVTKVGGSSARTLETIVNVDGELAAEAEAVIVKVDREARRPRPWSEAEQAAFAATGARARE
jgi:acyl-CoA thioester hydrolase